MGWSVYSLPSVLFTTPTPGQTVSVGANWHGVGDSCRVLPPLLLLPGLCTDMCMPRPGRPTLLPPLGAVPDHWRRLLCCWRLLLHGPRVLQAGAVWKRRLRDGAFFEGALVELPCCRPAPRAAWPHPLPDSRLTLSPISRLSCAVHHLKQVRMLYQRRLLRRPHLQQPAVHVSVPLELLISASAACTCVCGRPPAALLLRRLSPFSLACVPAVLAARPPAARAPLKTTSAALRPQSARRFCPRVQAPARRCVLCVHLMARPAAECVRSRVHAGWQVFAPSHNPAPFLLFLQCIPNTRYGCSNSADCCSGLSCIGSQCMCVACDVQGLLHARSLRASGMCLPATMPHTSALSARDAPFPCSQNGACTPQNGACTDSNSCCSAAPECSKPTLGGAGTCQAVRLRCGLRARRCMACSCCSVAPRLLTHPPPSACLPCSASARSCLAAPPTATAAPASNAATSSACEPTALHACQRWPWIVLCAACRLGSQLAFDELAAVPDDSNACRLLAATVQRGHDLHRPQRRVHL